MRRLDAVKSMFSGFVDSVMRRVDFLAFYPCEIKSQNSDGTLDLAPDSPRLASVSSVPIRYGVPGVAVKVTGGRALLGFEGGDPSKPVAALFGDSNVEMVFLGSSNATGSDVTQFVAIAEKVMEALDSIKQTFNSHTHTVSTTGTSAAQSGTAAAVISGIGSLGPVAAEKVKVK